MLCLFLPRPTLHTYCDPPTPLTAGSRVNPTRMSVPVTGTSPALPTIVGSPTKFHGALRFDVGTPVPEEMDASPLYTPFGGQGSRAKTCPNNIAAVGYCNVDGECSSVLELKVLRIVSVIKS